MAVGEVAAGHNLGGVEGGNAHPGGIEDPRMNEFAEGKPAGALGHQTSEAEVGIAVIPKSARGADLLHVGLDALLNRLLDGVGRSCSNFLYRPAAARKGSRTEVQDFSVRLGWLRNHDIRSTFSIDGGCHHNARDTEDDGANHGQQPHPTLHGRLPNYRVDFQLRRHLLFNICR